MYRLPAAVRPVVDRLAEVVCPPEVRTGNRLGPLVDELEHYLAVLPRYLQLGLTAAFLVFDRAARLFPRGRGRRFADLDDVTADAWFSAWAHSRVPALRNLAKAMKAPVTFSYYELPDVQREIGYEPAPYIERVSQRRLERYRDDIEAGEAAVHS